MKPRLKIKFLNKPFNSFHFFGVMGYFIGVIIGVWLAYYTHLAIWPVLLCALIGTGVFVGLTYLYKWITGKEDLVYYQHEIAILVCCFILLYALKRPVLEYLDISLMGIGVFLAFGRIGCFSVGCCHGRPNKKYGVLYSQEHVDEGFPEYYRGIPLFPIQLVESISVTVVTVLGISTIIMGSEPGTALLIYSIIYGLIRFVLEFFRGDPERPYWNGFSEAQWTTLAIFAISVGLGWQGLLPLYTWHIWAVVGLILFMLATVIVRKRQTIPKYKIMQPRHVSQIATGLAALEHQKSNGENILVAYTSLGLNISMGVLKSDEEETTFYTLSQERTKSTKQKFGLILNRKTTEVIGKLLRTLRHGEEPFEIVTGQTGIYHIVFGNYEDNNGGNLFADQSTSLNLRRNLRFDYN